jgi:hypothetical protein
LALSRVYTGYLVLGTVSMIQLRSVTVPPRGAGFR